MVFGLFGQWKRRRPSQMRDRDRELVAPLPGREVEHIRSLAERWERRLERRHLWANVGPYGGPEPPNH